MFFFSNLYETFSKCLFVRNLEKVLNWVRSDGEQGHLVKFLKEIPCVHFIGKQF